MHHFSAISTSFCTIIKQCVCSGAAADAPQRAAQRYLLHLKKVGTEFALSFLSANDSGLMAE